MTFFSNVKQKTYVLNPRGKPLYEDANRFGTKMLEKMGWSKGKGLGANEDGQQNFIRVSHKTDQKGMGYQDRDDQWTGHENQFNTLLESLHNSRNPSEDEKSEDEDQLNGTRLGFGFDSINDEKTEKSKSIKAKLSGKSLEELSKKSSVRVHYRKFTRGKDISKYSEKDLANIFGKKCINGDIVDASTIEAAKQQQHQHQQNDIVVQSNYGITTIETGTSVQDYFKMKKRKKELGDNCEDNGNDDGIINECTANTNGCEKKRRKKDKHTKSEQNVIESIENELPSNEIENPNKKKKKKKSKKESTIENQQPITMETIVVSEGNSDCEIVSIKMKKKKKRKNKKDSVENQDESIDITTTSLETLAIDVSADDVCSETTSKKKKRDKKRPNEVINAITNPEEVNKIASTPMNNTQFIDGILDLLVKHSPHSSAASSKQSNDEHDDSQTTPKTTPATTTTTNIAMDHVFEINRYHAEMFRFVDLDGFPDSNLHELNGYGFSKDLELKISEKSKDQTKINDLWDCALVNKYGMEVMEAKKAKKAKNYSISKLKKKNLFRKL